MTSRSTPDLECRDSSVLSCFSKPSPTLQCWCKSSTSAGRLLRMTRNSYGYLGCLLPDSAKCETSFLREFSVKRRPDSVSGDFQTLCQNAGNGKNCFHACCPVRFGAGCSSYGDQISIVATASFSFSIGLFRCPYLPLITWKLSRLSVNTSGR